MIRPLFNHLIAQSPEIQHRLADYAGRHFALHIPPVSLRALIDADGLLRNSTRAPETTLYFEASAMQKVLAGQTPSVGDIRIEGDHTLGMNLLPLLGSLRYYADEDVAKLFGEAAAGHFLSAQHKLERLWQEMKHTLNSQIGDWAQEDTALLVHQKHYQAHAQAIAALRDDVARLEVRMKQLKQGN